MVDNTDMFQNFQMFQIYNLIIIEYLTKTTKNVFDSDRNVIIIRVCDLKTIYHLPSRRIPSVQRDRTIKRKIGPSVSQMIRE